MTLGYILTRTVLLIFILLSGCVFYGSYGYNEFPYYDDDYFYSPHYRGFYYHHGYRAHNGNYDHYRHYDNRDWD